MVTIQPPNQTRKEGRPKHFVRKKNSSGTAVAHLSLLEEAFQDIAAAAAAIVALTGVLLVGAAVAAATPLDCILKYASNDSTTNGTKDAVVCLVTGKAASETTSEGSSKSTVTFLGAAGSLLVSSVILWILSLSSLAIVILAGAVLGLLVLLLLLVLLVLVLLWLLLVMVLLRTTILLVVRGLAITLVILLVTAVATLWRVTALVVLALVVITLA